MHVLSSWPWWAYAPVAACVLALIVAFFVFRHLRSDLRSEPFESPTVQPWTYAARHGRDVPTHRPGGQR